jgi:glycosyltransferase involved in cell wall biosynthesis
MVDSRRRAGSETLMHTSLLSPAVVPELVSLPAPVLDVVVPVHNEQAGLERCLRRLHAHLTSLPYPFRITVAENASTDGTVEVAGRIAAELPGIEVLVLLEPGRGRALRTAWLASDAPVLVYMDVDLSTDLAHAATTCCSG